MVDARSTGDGSTPKTPDEIFRTHYRLLLRVLRLAQIRPTLYITADGTEYDARQARTLDLDEPGVLSKVKWYPYARKGIDDPGSYITVEASRSPAGLRVVTTFDSATPMHIFCLPESYDDWIMEQALGLPVEPIDDKDWNITVERVLQLIRHGYRGTANM